MYAARAAGVRRRSVRSRDGEPDRRVPLRRGALHGRAAAARRRRLPLQPLPAPARSRRRLHRGGRRGPGRRARRHARVVRGRRPRARVLPQVRREPVLAAVRLRPDLDRRRHPRWRRRGSAPPPTSSSPTGATTTRSPTTCRASRPAARAGGPDAEDRLRRGRLGRLHPQPRGRRAEPAGAPRHDDVRADGHRRGPARARPRSSRAGSSRRTARGRPSRPRRTGAPRSPAPTTWSRRSRSAATGRRR